MTEQEPKAQVGADAPSEAPAGEGTGVPEHDHQHDEYASEPRLRDLPFTLFTAPRWLLLLLIRGYQMTLSKTLPPNTCRFYPSCSHYGYQAVYRYGALKGGLMAAWRLLRCNPFNPGGYDPVP